MRGTPPSVSVVVGTDPFVMNTPGATTLRVGNAVLSLNGTPGERRLLAYELASSLGLTVDLPGAATLEQFEAMG